MLINLDGQGALYAQIYRALRRAILNGELAPGARLPATRALCEVLGVSRNVVLLAYDQLLAEGYLAGRVGSGSYVASPLPEQMLRAPKSSAAEAPGPPGPARLSAYARRALLGAATGRTQSDEAAPRYDFRYGPTNLDGVALSVWRRLLAQHAALPPITYSPAEGSPALRAAVADYVRRCRGVRCDAEQVLIVTGSQQALDLVGRVLLEAGDRVLIEEPHYRGARAAFLSAGAELLPVEVDGEGFDIAAGEGSDARLAYVTPSHQFPTGAVMSLARRLALLQWAAREDAYVVEDDYDSEYRYEGRPVEAVQGLDRHGRTLYIGTFSKVLFPALRLGYLVVPPELAPAFAAAKWLADRHTPTLEQEALAELIAGGHFERHLRRKRREHAVRRETLLAALAEQLGERAEPCGTQAGVHLLVWLPGVALSDLEPLVERAARADVGVYSIAPYYLNPPDRAGLLLGYANLSEEEIREGVRRLATVIREG